MSKSPVVINMSEFAPTAVRYMQPRVNDRGGKSVTVISTQSNRALNITMPLMLTWGISDYVDEKGESDGKFTISLQFPRDAESTAETRTALKNMKEFENKIIEDAVTNSAVWFGKKASREIVEDRYFPFLKYKKDKETREVDYNSPPTLRPKVPCYDGEWKTEIFDPKGTLLFPCDVEGSTPMDFINKGSQVACVLQCGGLWFGGKGWGMIWKLTQAVVKPRVMDTVFGKGVCQIQLSAEDEDAIYKEPEAQVPTPVVAAAAPVTEVENSDDEEEVATPVEPEPEPVVEEVVEPEPEPEPEPVVEEVVEPEPAVVKKKTKKTVKKVVA